MPEKMKNAVAWFEIPAQKLGRAKKFYQSIFDIEMIDMDFGEELKMSMFPVEEGGVGGALCEHKDFYTPGYEGPVVYFDANPNLQKVLDKVESGGGKILQPKQQITEEYGYIRRLRGQSGSLTLDGIKYY